MLVFSVEDVYRAAIVRLAEEWCIQDEPATGRMGDRTFAQLDPDFRVRISEVETLRDMISILETAEDQARAREICDNLERCIDEQLDDAADLMLDGEE